MIPVHTIVSVWHHPAWHAGIHPIADTGSAWSTITRVGSVAGPLALLGAMGSGLAYTHLLSRRKGTAS